MCCNNADFGGRGHHKTGEDYTAAPNIDHTNEKVQEDIIGWLNHLRKVGFAGWRFDFVKGYHGRFAKMYVDATVPELAFGEFWSVLPHAHVESTLMSVLAHPVNDTSTSTQRTVLHAGTLVLTPTVF